MQNPMQYAPCPSCGQNNAKKIGFTFWGGALGPTLFTHVKCQNCQTEYNGKTGKSNQQNIYIYLVGSFLIFFCLCVGFTAFAYLLNGN